MSILSILFGKSSAGSNGSSKGPFVVDASSFLRGRNASPRDQLELMGRLSKFAEDEKVSITLVIDGSALRKVGHGETYKGVKVLFTEGKSVQDTISRAAKGKAVAVTDDVKLEKELQGRGATVLRASTFKRAFQGGSDSISSSRQGGQRRRSRRGRNGRPNQKSENREPAMAKSQGGDDISQYIDLVE